MKIPVMSKQDVGREGFGDQSATHPFGYLGARRSDLLWGVWLELPPDEQDHTAANIEHILSRNWNMLRSM